MVGCRIASKQGACHPGERYSQIGETKNKSEINCVFRYKQFKYTKQYQIEQNCL